MRQTTWAWRFASLVLVGLTLSVPAIWVFGGYLGSSFNEIIGYRVADGMCMVGTESLGQHCFSDFAVIRMLLEAPTLWDPSSGTATAYSPTAWFIPMALHQVGVVLSSPGVGLGLFLGICALSLLAPMAWVVSRDVAGRGAIAFAVLGVASVPFLVPLDRGNSTALLVAPLLVAAVSFSRERYGWTVAAIVVCTALKPQMLLLVLLLLGVRRYRLVLISVGASALTLIAGFVVWPGSITDNVRDWFTNASGYSGYATMDVAYPYSLGLGRSVLTTLDVTNAWALVGEEYRGHVINILTRFPSVLGIVAMAASVGVLWWRGQRTRPFYSVLVVVLLIIVSPGTSYSYYLALLLVPAALLLRDPVAAGAAPAEAGWSGALDSTWRSRIRMERLINGSVIVVLAACMVPLMAMPLIDHGSLVGAIQRLWGPLLAFLLVGMLLSVAWSKRE